MTSGIFFAWWDSAYRSQTAAQILLHFIVLVAHSGSTLTGE